METKNELRYHNIDPVNIENGDGIRCVIWLSGCIHNCPGCFNPQTHDPNSGLLVFDETGSVIDELMDAVQKEYCAGITFSGGDPLYSDNPKWILPIAQAVKEKYNKSVWMWTGYTAEYFLNNYPELAQYVDVLVDGPFIEKYACKEYHWAGSCNQRVIDIQKTLEFNNELPDGSELQLIWLDPSQRSFANEFMREVDGESSSSEE